MYNLKFSEESKMDIDEIRRYISKDGIDIANKQIRKMRAKAKTLRDFPNLGKKLEGTDYRFLVSAPYLIFYRVHERQMRVEVARILDGRRDYMKVLKFTK